MSIPYSFILKIKYYTPLKCNDGMNECVRRFLYGYIALHGRHLCFQCHTELFVIPRFVNFASHFK